MSIKKRGELAVLLIVLAILTSAFVSAGIDVDVVSNSANWSYCNAAEDIRC